MFSKQTLKQHVQKWNEIIVWIKSFEQTCILPNYFLNQGELAAHCSFIGTKDADFNLQCIPNAKRLFSETVSPKKHGQVSLDKKGWPVCTSCFLKYDFNCHYHTYAHRGTNIFYIIKCKEGSYHKDTVIIWCFLPENLWCWNGMVESER